MQELHDLKQQIEAMEGKDMNEDEQEALELKRLELRIKTGYKQRRERGAEPYPPLLVFPEGTTTGDDTLLQFKSGAFSSGMPVQPVICKFPFCAFDAVWSSDQSLGWLVWRMLCQVRVRVLRVRGRVRVRGLRVGILESGPNPRLVIEAR